MGKYGTPSWPTLPFMRVFLVGQSAACLISYIYILCHACLWASRQAIRRAIFLNGLYLVVGVARNVMYFIFLWVGSTWSLKSQYFYLTICAAPFSMGFAILYGNQSRHLRLQSA